jgi:glucose/arabinose dehydrogenase
MRRFGLSLVVVVLAAAACTSEPAPTVVSPPSTPSTSAESTTATTGTSTASAEPGTSTTTLTTTSTTTVPIAETMLGLEVVAEGFSQPVLAVPAAGRLYVVEQAGRIWVLDDAGAEVFLDITEPVSFGGEGGLLGLAFHPEHDDLLYVNYTGLDGATYVAEYRFDEDGGDRRSERIVLRVAQPARNHNGGMIAFGPDGDLWVGMGDGGGSDDRFGHGQRGDTLLAAMLRVVVGPEVSPYGVAGDSGFEAPEVWAIGLRNPWRFAFDGRELWIADVGQNAFEEVNRVSVDDRGLNFAWPLHEGTSCYRGGSRCDTEDLTAPIYEYKHPEGCSITGGYVYRGQAIPQLAGHYFFSDFCTGFLRSIAPSGEVFDWTDQTGSVPSVTSFGVDVDGELLVISGDGTVYRVVEG